MYNNWWNSVQSEDYINYTEAMQNNYFLYDDQNCGYYDSGGINSVQCYKNFNNNNNCQQFIVPNQNQNFNNLPSLCAFNNKNDNQLISLPLPPSLPPPPSTTTTPVIFHQPSYHHISNNNRQFCPPNTIISRPTPAVVPSSAIFPSFNNNSQHNNVNNNNTATQSTIMHSSSLIPRPQLLPLPQQQYYMDIDSHAPCQGPKPWNYAYCYGYYGEPACQFVDIVDIEDFM